MVEKIPEDRRFGDWKGISVFNAFTKDKDMYRLALKCFSQSIGCRDASWLMMHATCLLVRELERLGIKETVDGVPLDEPQLFRVLIDMKHGFHDDLHG